METEVANFQPSLDHSSYFEPSNLAPPGLQTNPLVTINEVVPPSGTERHSRRSSHSRRSRHSRRDSRSPPSTGLMRLPTINTGQATITSFSDLNKNPYTHPYIYPPSYSSYTQAQSSPLTYTQSTTPQYSRPLLSSYQYRSQAPTPEQDTSQLPSLDRMSLGYITGTSQQPQTTSSTWSAPQPRYSEPQPESQHPQYTYATVSPVQVSPINPSQEPARQQAQFDYTTVSPAQPQPVDESREQSSSPESFDETAPSWNTVNKGVVKTGTGSQKEKRKGEERTGT